MSRLSEFNERRKENYLSKGNNLFIHLKTLNDTLSDYYNIEKIETLISLPEDTKTVENELTNKEEADDNNGCNFCNALNIVTYLNNRINSVKKIEEEARKRFSDNYYFKRLEDLSVELDDFMEWCKKKKGSEKYEMLDNFTRKYLKRVKEFLLEDIVENLHNDIKREPQNEFYNWLIDELERWMIEAGFTKKELAIGEEGNTRYCEISKNVVKTEDPQKHKKIKEIIWSPYTLRCYTVNDAKCKERIIRGKVICYSNKVKD